MYFKIYQDTRLYWRWTLRAANHLTIADSSEGYASKQNAIEAADRVKSGAFYAQVYT